MSTRHMGTFRCLGFPDGGLFGTDNYFSLISSPIKHQGDRVHFVHSNPISLYAKWCTSLNNHPKVNSFVHGIKSKRQPTVPNGALVALSNRLKTQTVPFISLRHPVSLITPPQARLCRYDCSKWKHVPRALSYFVKCYTSSGRGKTLPKGRAAPSKANHLVMPMYVCA